MSNRTQATGVFEHEGLLWKPRDGCTSSLDEQIAARQRWLEIFHETQWNPWRKEELQPEADRARAVMDEWTRGEPDHRMMTDQEVQDWLETMRKDAEAKNSADDARNAREAKRYDREREQARFALLELEASLAGTRARLAGLRDGTVQPSLAAQYRAAQVAEAAARIAKELLALEPLVARVGDPEDVVDVHGRLPADRRPLNLVMYSCVRRAQVPELQASTEKLQAEIGAVTDRTITFKLKTEEHRLSALLAVPRLTAEDMCADCATPLAEHLAGSDSPRFRPCPSWPQHAARMENAWKVLRSAADRAQPGATEPPKPQPLATLPGNLAIGEVIARLSELQEQHPDAVVKRGRTNRWELWPKDS